MTPALPQPAAALAKVAEQRQFLTFSLGGQTFALSIEHVREIIEFDEMTEVPMMPEFVRGVINLRGAVVPVIDMQCRFGRGQTSVGKRTCVVIAEVTHEGSRHLLGTIVDSVNEVLNVDTSRIEAKPAFGTGLRQDFVEGILNLDGKFVVVLDIACALSVQEMAELVTSAELGAELEHAKP